MKSQSNLSSFKSFIINWSNSHPFDRWWRMKHKVAFGSPQHREMNFIDQRLEFEEDKLFLELENDTEKSDDRDYYNQTGQWLKPSRDPKMKQDEIDEIYDDIDIDELNKQTGNSNITFE